MPVQIIINGENAGESIKELATLSAALMGKKEVPSIQAPQQQTPVPQPIQQPLQQAPVQQAPTAVPTATPLQPVPMQQAPVQQPFQQPVTPQQQAPIQQPVPTTTATYTMDQLAVAATQLMDAGRQQDLINLLHSFGAQSLMQVPKEQYGAFATKLREMGAKI